MARKEHESYHAPASVTQRGQNSPQQLVWATDKHITITKDVLVFVNKQVSNLLQGSDHLVSQPYAYDISLPSATASVAEPLFSPLVSGSDSPSLRYPSIPQEWAFGLKPRFCV